MNAEEVVAKMSGLLPGQEVYIEWSVVVMAGMDETFTVSDHSSIETDLTADEAAETAAQWVTENRNRHKWEGGAE